MDIYDEKKQRASPTPKEVIHEKSKKVYGSLMDIFDYPKREAKIKQAIKMHILSEKG